LSVAGGNPAAALSSLQRLSRATLFSAHSRHAAAVREVSPEPRPQAKREQDAPGEQARYGIQDAPELRHVSDGLEEIERRARRSTYCTLCAKAWGSSL
jgi:hypothetical protein